MDKNKKDDKVLENKDIKVEVQPKPRRGRPPKNAKKDVVKEEKLVEEKIEVKSEDIKAKVSNVDDLRDTIKDAIKEVVNAVKESSEPEEENLRKRKTVRFEHHEEVVVTSLVKRGDLVFEDHEGVIYRWPEYGSEEWLSIKALRHMRNRHRGFFTKPLVMVDEDVAIFLKVDTMYQDIVDVDNMEKIFNLSVEDFEEKLISYPSGIKELVIDMAIKMIKDGTLDSMRMIRVIEKICKVELTEQADRSFIVKKK